MDEDTVSDVRQFLSAPDQLTMCKYMIIIDDSIKNSVDVVRWKSHGPSTNFSFLLRLGQTSKHNVLLWGFSTTPPAQTSLLYLPSKLTDQYPFLFTWVGRNKPGKESYLGTQQHNRVGILVRLCIIDPLICLWTRKFQLKLTITHPSGCASIHTGKNILCRIIDNILFLSTKLPKYRFTCSKLAGEVTNCSKL